MTESAIKRIGFIGLGNMGTPMVARLVEGGFEVTAFDVADAAVQRAVDHGATGAASAGDAVRGADAVILMLPNSQIVASVLADPSVSDGFAADLTIIDMSSSDPSRTRELAGELDARGVRMVDAPVSGGVKGAVAGNLTIMVGGSDVDVAHVRPVLDVFGHVVRAGSLGAGHAIKVLNNLLSATHLWVTSEAMVIGEKFGLEPETMLSIFNGSSGRSGSTENKWPNFILPGGYDSGFGLALMLKDMKIAIELAGKTGVPAELGKAAVAEWQKAADALPPTADHTEVARFLGQDDSK